MGDPAGIGPEIIIKAVAMLEDRIAAGEFTLLVVGAPSCLAACADRLHLPWDAPAVDEPDGAGPVVMVRAGEAAAPIRVGEVQADAGDLAFRAVERAVRLCLDGKADAIVTAPLNKEALNLAGHAYAGHTDMLADLTGARDSIMMLAHGPMRVSHVTTHCALADVPAKLTPARLGRVLDVTEVALRDLGIEAPRIAVAALNPHAGEGGIFGREDIEVTTPVVADYRARGHAVDGPVPGDTVFVKLRAGQYDAVVAIYHDQGHIPVKLLGFAIDPETGRWESMSGVNITLGLPIIRTSVDHGTAFDIADKGVANADSLVEAIDFALVLAAARTAAGAGG
jgi:4-hydroxythreonine-4-phosphate dehydrogenase